MRCIFGEIVAGRADSDTLYQDEVITAFRDIRPQAPTHILILPNEHIASMEDLYRSGNSLVAKMFSTAHHLAEAEGIAEGGYRLVMNTGPEAGRLIDHLHLHLLGGKRMSQETMALRFKDGLR
ncbi:MAG: histidine triad nucleotide-binding protein [Chloroflexi bacterium B3_Chlor]|nr:MAG: histidine triad nucleotide-binding protein [Chloroflexi bacterium B3_Chlor]